MEPNSDLWLAVLQGNTHHRWGWFKEQDLHKVEIFPSTKSPPLPEDLEIWIAQVGSAPKIPKDHPRLHQINLAEIPLHNLYPSLGIDRALGVMAAGKTLGWPTLVIDAGTALTLTGADQERRLVGGAICPGLLTQTRSLNEHTATLPSLSWSSFPTDLPRWATETSTAIYSGIHHTIVAGLRSFCWDWLRSFPESRIGITGGDGELIDTWLGQDLELRPRLKLEPNLVLIGIACCRQDQQNR